jgi:hypothetical protein
MQQLCLLMQVDSVHETTEMNNLCVCSLLTKLSRSVLALKLGFVEGPP